MPLAYERLDQSKLQGNPKFHSSTTRWIPAHQERRSKAEWTLWRKANRLWSTATGDLHTELGQWLRPRSQKRHKRFAYLHHNCRLYIRRSASQYQMCTPTNIPGEFRIIPRVRRLDSQYQKMWPNLFKVPHLLAIRIIGMYIQTGKVFISLHLDLRLKHSPNTSKLLPRGKLTYSEWQQCTSIPHLRYKILLLCLNMTFFHIYMIFFIAQTWTKRVVQLWFGSSFLRFISTKSSELCKILVSFCVTCEVANRICVTNYL